MSIILCPWNIICLHFWGCFLLPSWILRKSDGEFKLLNLNLFSVWHQQILCRHYITLHKRSRDVCVTNLPRSYEFLRKNKTGQILYKPQSASMWGGGGGFKLDVSELHFALVKVKQSHYRPGQAVRVPGDWGYQIWRQSAHESSKAVSPTNRPPLPPGNIPVTHFSVRVWVNPRVIVRPEWLCQYKIPVTPSGIEPAPFRLVDILLRRREINMHTIGRETFRAETVWKIRT
jgi:hypothetical protein